jgi:hypothetical protein
MARPLRIEYPGAYYHVTSRGNERKAIFRDDRDRGDIRGRKEAGYFLLLELEPCAELTGPDPGGLAQDRGKAGRLS